MSDDEAALRDLIADLAGRHTGPTPPGELPKAWADIRDLGLDSIGIDEASGGSGGTLGHLAVIVDALGEAGLGVPIIEVSTARWLLARADADHDAALPIVAPIEQAERGGAVSGVGWGRHADLVVAVPARGELTIHEIRSEPAGVANDVNLAGEPRDVVTLSDARAKLPSDVDAEAVRARLGLLWSAALTGAVRGAYRKTRDHVREREQFGAPLIKIPAVAGALANFKTRLLLAEAALARAVDTLGEDGELPDTASVAVARIVVSSAATEAARLAHQLHGAMGITQEGGLHRLTTRLWAWQDAVTTERDWSIMLGERAIDSGEEHLWSELTSAF